MKKGYEECAEKLNCKIIKANQMVDGWMESAHNVYVLADVCVCVDKSISKSVKDAMPGRETKQKNSIGGVERKVFARVVPRSIQPSTSGSRRQRAHKKTVAEEEVATKKFHSAIPNETA